MLVLNHGKNTAEIGFILGIIRVSNPYTNTILPEDHITNQTFGWLFGRHGQYLPHRPVLPTIPIHQIPNITNAQQAVSTLAYHAKQLIHNSQTLATTQTKLGQLATLLTSIILSKTTQNQQLLFHTTTLKNIHSTFSSIFAPTST